MNPFKEALIRQRLFEKRYKELFKRFCEDSQLKIVDSAQTNSPFDFGSLRESFKSDIEFKDNTAIINVANSEQYAAYVEEGFNLKPGMVLRMQVRQGNKLRFIKLLKIIKLKKKTRFARKKKKYGNLGDIITIVTTKRKIKGRHMLKRAVNDTVKDMPKTFERLVNTYLIER